MNPTDNDNTPDELLREIYDLKNIAVVGMSPKDGKPANYVPKYLSDKGFNVIPVNPNYKEIMSRKAYNQVSEVPFEVDIVDIFRKSEDVLQVVEDAVLKDEIKVIWMQKGIYNKKAKEIAEKKGIKVIYNRCMLEEHQRLFSYT